MCIIERLVGKCGMKGKGLLLARLILGITFIVHGSQKLAAALSAQGLSGFAGMLKTMGVPAPDVMAWVVFLVEFVGGILVVIGFLAREAAFAIAVDMVVAIALVHGKNGFFNPMGYEFPLALLGLCLVIIYEGPGWLSLEKAKGETAPK